MTTSVVLRIDEALHVFLPSRHRGGDVDVAYDGTSSLGHVVQSVGPPLTEVGSLVVAGRAVEPSSLPVDGDVVLVRPPRRPQRLAGWPRFVLDVHLGSLSRRLRLLGVDTAYSTDATDDALVQIALRERRVLLSKDRGLLRRRAMWGHAAHVRGDRADEQLADVIGRFDPPRAPFTRCPACNGDVHPVAKAEVAGRLEPGTVRSYDEFAECDRCARVYWRGAHSARLDAMVAAGASSTRDPRPSQELGAGVRLVSQLRCAV
ncbi:MAG: hypothetical protein H0V07_02980 [Propionibacteriales bacterium]|nr:hypothetical protein [Propionibacteriales bacterium]